MAEPDKKYQFLLTKDELSIICQCLNETTDEKKQSLAKRLLDKIVRQMLLQNFMD